MVTESYCQQVQSALTPLNFLEYFRGRQAKLATFLKFERSCLIGVHDLVMRVTILMYCGPHVKLIRVTSLIRKPL